MTAQMTSYPSPEEFLKKWRWALRTRRGPANRYWEGQRALFDLKRTNYLDRVRLEEEGDPEGAFGDGLAHFAPSHALPKIFSVLSAYRGNITRVRSLVEFQKNHEEWLTQEANRIRKKANLIITLHPVPARRLKRIAKKVDEARREIHMEVRQHWRKPSLGVVLPFKGHKSLTQERELDSWFQVRLGTILRTFMPKDPLPAESDARGPSLRTIARLVVLFLVCADLADVVEDEIRLKHGRNRRLSVEGVLQQLRGAGIG